MRGSGHRRFCHNTAKLCLPRHIGTRALPDLTKATAICLQDANVLKLPRFSGVMLRNLIEATFTGNMYKTRGFLDFGNLI